MNHLNILNSGESDISWVTVYMNLTNEEPSFSKKECKGIEVTGALPMDLSRVL